jgi:hypothetical protein
MGNAAKYYLNLDGTTVGPMTRSQILSAAKDGKIDRNTPIRRGGGGNGEWIRAGRVKGLFNDSNEDDNGKTASDSSVEREHFDESPPDSEAPRQSSESRAPLAEQKLCPYCAETILRAAVKCRYCGEFFDQASEAEAGHSSATNTPIDSPAVRDDATVSAHRKAQTILKNLRYRSVVGVVCLLAVPGLIYFLFLVFNLNGLTVETNKEDGVDVGGIAKVPSLDVRPVTPKADGIAKAPSLDVGPVTPKADGIAKAPSLDVPPVTPQAIFEQSLDGLNARVAAVFKPVKSAEFNGAVYDIRKTESLVSPLTAFITVKALVMFGENSIMADMKLTFSYQDDKWLYVSVDVIPGRISTPDGGTGIAKTIADEILKQNMSSFFSANGPQIMNAVLSRFPDRAGQQNEVREVQQNEAGKSTIIDQSVVAEPPEKLRQRSDLTPLELRRILTRTFSDKNNKTLDGYVVSVNGSVATLSSNSGIQKFELKFFGKYDKDYLLTGKWKIEQENKINAFLERERLMSK